MTYDKNVWNNRILPRVNATNLNKIEQGIYDAHEMTTGRSASFVIAANDSSAQDKRQADYVCDGVDDQVQIQAAIDAMPDTVTTMGGRLYFTIGEFYINGKITVDKPVVWQGAGIGERMTVFKPTATMDETMIDVVTGHYYGGMYDLTFSGSLMAQYVNPTADTFIDILNSGDYSFNRVGFFEIPYKRAVYLRCHGAWVYGCNFEDNRMCTSGAITLENTRNWIQNTYFARNTRSIGMNTGEQTIDNCVFTDSSQHHILLQGSEKVTISNSRFATWNTGAGGEPAMRFWSTVATHYNIHDCIFDGAACNALAIWDGDVAVDYINIRHNDFHGFGAIVPVDMTFANANGMIRDNIGFATENSGTATLPSASTSIAVTHGLSVTPVAGDIMVTPLETWGNMTKFWLDTYTATQFTVHADIAPGADTDFAWKAIVL